MTRLTSGSKRRTRPPTTCTKATRSMRPLMGSTRMGSKQRRNSSRHRSPYRPYRPSRRTAKRTAKRTHPCRLPSGFSLYKTLVRVVWIVIGRRGVVGRGMGEILVRLFNIYEKITSDGDGRQQAFSAFFRTITEVTKQQSASRVKKQQKNRGTN
uniref:Uncharacterized protein n=1 Tax=Anopheles culicifacies TaxID=139723 RepID=A0A182MHZ4_9DIPT